MPYTKGGSPLYIELHRRLFDSSEDAHDELNHFFTDINPVEMDGFLAMLPHEHLLYLLLHTPTSTSSAAASGCGSSVTSACGRGRITRKSTGNVCTSSARASTRRPLPQRRSALPETISASNLTCTRRGAMRLT